MPVAARRRPVAVSLVFLTLGVLVLTTLIAVQIANAATACRISEYPCKSGRCVRLDRYCDGSDDCGDGSDEPRYCTVCNRTYYGDVGKTYELKLVKPLDGRLPFLCHLTFTANGHIHGDIVQLIFDAFNVGRYEPSALDGCPDGYMQLSELGRPFTGGSWCGSSSGYAVYYSETSTITVSVKLFHARPNAPFDFKLRYKFVSQMEAIVRFGAPSAPLERGQVSPGTYCTRNYEECYRKPCRLQSPNYPGMYPRNVTCYWSLRQKTVPTCKHAMIAVRQEAEHKMQMKRSISMASINKTGRALKAWKECTGERDHLIFYDGGSTNDPVLVKYCGGDWLPRVVSRGPEMLVAFHSSPFSIPLHSSTATSPLRGFELDVDIIFADSDSLDYSREARRCEFHVHASSGMTSTVVATSTATEARTEDATRGRKGRILSPRHTLPPNTTCEWTFHGRPGDLVWIYFVSYSHHPLIPPPDKDPENGQGPPIGPPSVLMGGTVPGRGRYSTRLGAAGLEYGRMIDPSREKLAKPNVTAPTECTTRLRIWDGGGPEEPNQKLLADHCDDEGPRLCDHTSLSILPRVTRPCTREESYISSGPKMVLHHHTVEGTALHPATFKLMYEFVDTRLGGESWSGAFATGGILQDAGAEMGVQGAAGSCARIFKKIKEADFSSPKNIFLYGRGGANNLTCAYRIEAGPGERVRLIIRNVSMGVSGSCITEQDIHTGRPKCVHQTKNRLASLRIWDAPWKDVRVPRACICDNTTTTEPRPLVIKSSSKALELLFTISSFSITEDFTDYYFYASFELISASDCSRKSRLRGSGGEEEVAFPARSRSEAACDGMPWYVEARDNRSLFILTWGTLLPLAPSQDEPTRCSSRNRFLVYTGRPPKLIKIICPSEPNSKTNAVQIFSEDWFSHSNQPNSPAVYLTPPKPPSFLIEYVAKDSGIAGFTWMEITKSRTSLLQQLQVVDAIEPVEKIEYNDSLSAFNSDCMYRCPELNACISSSLWCDGRLNCPSGYDENEMHCGVGRRFFKQFPGGVYTALGCTAAVLAACILFTIFALIARFRRSRDRRLGKKKLLATADGRRLTEELLLDPGSNTNTVSS